MGHIHCEGHDHSHADGWTNATAAIELVIGSFETSIGFATTCDVITGLEATNSKLPATIPAFIFGAVIGVFSALGSAYCHRETNTRYQGTNCDHGTSDELTSLNPINPNIKSLSWHHWILLAGDGVGHCGEFAGSGILLLQLINPLVLQTIAGRVSIYSGLWAFSMLGTVAPVRSCYNIIYRRLNPVSKSIQNEETDQPATTPQIYRADMWTNINLALNLSMKLIGNIYTINVILNSAFNLAATLLGLFSIPGLALGACIGLFATLGFVICEYKFNLLNQFKKRPEHESKAKLTLLDKFSLAMTYIASTGAYTGPISMGFDLIVKHARFKPSSGERLGTNFAGLFVGLTAAFAEWRTDRNNLLDYNSVYPAKNSRCCV